MRSRKVQKLVAAGGIGLVAGAVLGVVGDEEGFLTKDQALLTIIGVPVISVALVAVRNRRMA